MIVSSSHPRKAKTPVKLQAMRKYPIKAGSGSGENVPRWNRRRGKCNARNFLSDSGPLPEVYVSLKNDHVGGLGARTASYGYNGKSEMIQISTNDM